MPTDTTTIDETIQPTLGKTIAAAITTAYDAPQHTTYRNSDKAAF